MQRPATTRRDLRHDHLEDRCVLSVTLGDLTAAGISQRVADHIDTSPYETQILADATLENTLRSLNDTQVAPPTATVLTSVGDLSQITAGTTNSPNVYLIQGNLTLTGTINVPSNVHIYLDGSIFKQGSFTAPGGVHSVENVGSNADAIFRLNGSDNVKLIGVNNALLHSTPSLSVNSPHTTAVFIHSNSTNVEVDGFEMAFVWNGVAAHPFNIHDITVTNNYIHDTLDRAVWSLGTTNFRAAHNFVENAGIDSFDWDAFTDDAIGYENVSIAAGRWAGFVEEGTEDSSFIRGLGIIADFGNPNRGFMLGWADNGSSAFFVGNNPNPSEWTEHNYFINNVIFDQNNVPMSGGDYFAKNNNGKGPTYFWGNRGFGAGQSTTNFDNAEWLTFLPTAGGRNNAVNAVQLLADLDAEFNTVTGIVLSAPGLTVSEVAAIGTVVGTVTPLNADVNDLSFTITAGNDGGTFGIDDDGVITVAAPLDFETQSSYVLTVGATDSVLTGTAGVSITVESPFATVKTLFDHNFVTPDFFDAADIRNQQGWVGQSSWAVEDAAGQGYATSGTTVFEGVTNNARADVEAGETIRIEMDLDLDVSIDTNSDQFRFGVTTLDSSGSFVPALGNNGGSILSGKLRYLAADDSIEFTPVEGSGSVITVPGVDLGLDLASGDGQTDNLSLKWDATKSDIADQWDVLLRVENNSTGGSWVSPVVTVTEAATHGTTTGLYAGVRGLQNSTQTNFRIDRYAYETVTPGSVIEGDYNFDGVVNAIDYTIWRDSEGQNGPTLPADGDRDGDVDETDRGIWQANYGATASEPPSSLATLVADAEAPVVGYAAFSSTDQGSGPRARQTVARGFRPAGRSESLLLYQPGTRLADESIAEQPKASDADQEEASPVLAIDEALALGVSL